MVMSASPELITVKNCASKLETALKGCDSPLVHFLRKEGFISDDVHEKVLNPQSMLTTVQKAGELVKGIERRVELDPSSFQLLLNCFKQMQAAFFQPIVKILEKEYHKLDDSGNGAYKVHVCGLLIPLHAARSYSSRSTLQARERDMYLAQLT